MGNVSKNRLKQIKFVYKIFLKYVILALFVECMLFEY